MAPHMLRYYHSIGDPGRYSLRVIKHGENNVPRPQHVDTSQIRGKEGFLLCMGLQMRRSRHKYTSDSSCRPKTVNIPASVMLRDCCVVILGAKCDICGKCFKCKTDLDVHMKLKHVSHMVKNTTTTETQCTEYDNEIYKIFADPFKHDTIAAGKNGELKIQKKFRLTLRIGEEVVAKIAVKRKHLKMRAINISTQTEPYDIAELNTDKDGYESNVSHIDSPLFRKGPCRCCNSLLRIVDSSDQYLVSSIVARTDSVGKENATLSKHLALNGFTESRTTFENCSCIPDKESYDFVESYLTSSLNSKEKDDDVIVLRHSTNNLSRDANKNGKQRDINANEVLIDISSENQKEIDSVSENSVIPQLDLEPALLQQHFPSQQQSAPSSQPSALLQQSAPLESSSVPQQLVPQQSSRERRRSEPPSVVPYSQSVLSRQMSTPNVQSASLQQQSTPIQTLPFQQSSISNSQSTPLQQSTPLRRTTTPVVEQTFDDEIQEVLRIVRGYNNREDINHESPNRYEQELLLKDVIEDMRRMEERGLHLLEKKYPKKRKRSAKNIGSTNDSVKKKKKASVQSNEKNTENSTKTKSSSNTREHVTKTQKQNDASVGDILKENLINGNVNINSTNEVLRNYGINLYNDVFEINNNTENIQEPVHHFLAPCSAGMENRSNRPIVIDLVNDTDE